MEKVSKLTTKKLLIILAAIFASCLVAIGIFAYAKNAVQTIASDEEYKYVNPDETKAETDSGFKIDGILDEAQYQNNKWLYLHNENGDATVDIATTSYYGEKGMYFVWDVTESTPIYVNLERSVYLNSSVELYFSPSNVKNMNSNDVFEVDMLPTGDMVFKQRNGKGGWMFVPTTDDIMAYLGATTKGGDVNTKDCYGYNLELFIPWEYLEWLGADVDEMQENFVYANTAHNTSFNYEGTDADIDRFWYSFATQLGGNGFSDVDQYFRFDGTGVLGTVPVTFEQGEHCTITGAKSVIPGLKASITIMPEKGYALNSILVNGEEWIKKVSYNEDGSVTFFVKGVKEGLTISASAEPITEGNKTISGTVILNKMGGDTLEGVSISYKGPQGEKPVELDGKGNFVLKDLKQGYYTIIVEKEGYTKLVRNICLNRDVETELTLEYDLFDIGTSNAWDIEEQNDGILWKKSRKSGALLTKDSYNKFSLAANLRYDSDLSKVSDDDLYKQQRSGLRVKFSNDKYWNVDIMRADDKYVVQYAKHFDDKSIFNWTQLYVLSEKDIAAYKSEKGIELKIVRDGQYGNVYLGGKLIAIEDLGKEFKNCTANLGFEFYVANQEFLQINYNIASNNIKVVKEGIFARGGFWDISKQFDGSVTLNYGGSGSLRFAKDYVNMDLTLWVKDDPKGTEPEEQSPRTDVKYTFENDKFVTFSVLRVSDKQVMVQSMGGDKSITGWKGWYNLSEEEMAQYNSETGVPFRIVRIGTEFSIYIGDKMVGYQDFAGNIKADTKATVDLRHWGDEGVDLEIPFKVTDDIVIVNITNVGNGKGKVVTKKKNHFVGDTVVLTGDGGYYCYEMKVDGNQVQLNQDGTYTFVATKKDYTVEGTFAERIFVDNEEWNTLSQKDGLVYLPNGGGDDKPLQFYKKYADLDLEIKAKNDPKGTETEEQSPRTDIKFEFENGKFATFSVLRISDEQVMIQSMGGKNSITGWKGWYNLTEAERNLYNSEEGIGFRVVRIGAGISLFIGDKFVNYVDMTDSIGENEKATVYLRHWGDHGVKLEIPFKITEKVDKVAKIGNAYFNSLEAAMKAAKDNATIVVLEDITVNSKMTVGKNITITNSKDVTITRGEALYNAQTFEVWEEGTLTIKGAEGTKFIIDGGSDEATNARFAWVGGIFKSENVTIKNFKAKDHGAVIYSSQDATIELKDSIFDGNTSTAKSGAVIYNLGTLKVIGATFSDNASNYDGGAIYSKSAVEVVVKNSEFIGNVSSSNGGAIFNEGGTITLTNTDFVDNKATGNGGAIGSGYSAGIITITGGNFQGNQANSGAAIAGWASTITINGSPTFANNTTTSHGGAIRAIGATTLTINGGTFSGNEAGGGAGAIYPDSATTITKIASGVEFIGNKATTNGGVIYNAGQLEIASGVVFDSNTAVGQGGAIYNSAGTVIDKGATYKNNISNGGAGGALRNQSGTMELTNTRFIGNTSTDVGGAVYATGGAPIKAVGCYFEGNKGIEAGAIYHNGAGSVIKDCTFKNNAKTGSNYNAQSVGIAYGTIENATFESDSNDVRYEVVLLGDKSVAMLAVKELTASENAIKITPVDYQKTTQFVVNRLNDAAEDAFSSVTVLIEVTRDKNDVLWALNTNGYLTDAEASLSSNGKSYATLAEAIAARAQKDTIIVYKDAVWNNYIEVKAGQELTITNASNVTLTRGDGLKSAGGAMVDVPENGKLILKGAEGTTFKIKGASTEATGNRFAWVGGTLNFENVTVTNFKSTAAGAVIYNDGTVNMTDSTFGSNTSAKEGAVVYNVGTFSVTDSTFSKNTSTLDGGAIYHKSAVEVVINNSEFTGNESASHGGAIFNENKTVTLTDTDFSKNKATGNGGAIGSGYSGGTVTITGGTFSENEANEGGVICGWSSSITIDGSATFSKNKSASHGGALRAVGGTLTIKGGIFSENASSKSAGVIYPSGGASTRIAPGVQFKNNTAKVSGGVIYNGGSLTLYTEGVSEEQMALGVLFEGNKASEKGGAIYSSGTMTVTGFKFKNNTSDSHGGAVHVAGANATFTECEFINNRANYGGAIMTPSEDATTITLQGCTFTGNYAKANGGALYIWANDKVILQKSGNKVNVFTNNYSSDSAVNNQSTCHGSTGKDYVKDGTNYYYNHINLAGSPVGQCECSTAVAQFNYK